MEIIETPVFTDWVCKTLKDEDYMEFQFALMEHPDMGDLIPGGHGLRKVRWKIPGKGKGKRGGVRIIYYWFVKESQILLLLAYEKAEKGNLTAREIKLLREIVEREMK